MLPAVVGEQFADEARGAAAEGQECDAAGVELGQHGVGGEAGVEDELAGALAEGVGEAQHGGVLIGLADVGVGETEDVLAGVAGEEGEHAALAARALGDEVLFEERLLAVVGDGMEVYRFTLFRQKTAIFSRIRLTSEGLEIRTI